MTVRSGSTTGVGRIGRIAATGFDVSPRGAVRHQAGKDLVPRRTTGRPGAFRGLAEMPALSGDRLRAEA